MAAPKKPNPNQDESLESLKAWWYENGKYFVASALVGLFAVGGWKVWDYNQQMSTREASGIYAGLLVEVEDENRDESERLFAELRDDYAGTTYPALGALSMAKLEVADGNLREAAEHLRWAIEQTDQEGLRSLMRVRLMRVLLEAGEAQTAAGLMEEHDFPRGVEALAADANGDVMYSLQQRRAAVAAYREALSLLPDDYGLIKMKLQMLGISPGDDDESAPVRAPSAQVPETGAPDIVR